MTTMFGGGRLAARAANDKSDRIVESSFMPGAGVFAARTPKPEMREAAMPASIEHRFASVDHLHLVVGEVFPGEGLHDLRALVIESLELAWFVFRQRVVG